MSDVVPACGGTEPISVIKGRRWQYVYQPSSGRHGYLDVDNDLITWHRSFHPAFAPQFEGQSEPSMEVRMQEWREQDEVSLYW
ncbi:hypothetical protein DET61_11622 [Marinobacter nauticus]|jgi:hypothetical protein|uniref:Uncharacterized protein n=1 Tax=Marinobacter nauticus TaxID=2743 RepID=A0A368X7K5_MARNT|nr:hypothetical protein DET61_11622 [Marinobacter nauticus]|tara:strand:+ start:451 stop:699 length:249 start_codon:yes stop_codon:yes gene_type:complete